MKRRVVLIGLDGATFTILDPLMRDGAMPFLAQLTRGGVRAPLRSVVPALTPPAWTSLVTGRSPGHHGIFDFFCRESPQDPHIRVATSRDIGVETLWSIAHRHGLRTTALNFPLMFPPPRIGGFVVPGWMPWRQLRLGCHPDGLFDRIKALPGVDTRELAMDMATEAKAIEGCRADEYESWIELHIRRERQWFEILRHLMKEEPSELTAVLLDGVDKIQHLCWRFLDPAYAGSLEPGWPERIRDLCVRYFRELDGLIAEIVDLAGPDATVVLASDHGFGAQTGTFFANTWLEERGYLAWSDGPPPYASGPNELGIGELARHVFKLDWSRTKAYACTPSSNGIHIVTAGSRNPHGVPTNEYGRFRDRLAEELREVRDPDGRAVFSRVWSRDEVFQGPHGKTAPDLTLELADGGLISILSSDEPFKPRPEPSGTHRPDGIFIGKGPGWRQGASLPALSILDVTPVLLHGLGLSVPQDLEGRFPSEAFDDEALRRWPLRQGPATRTPATTGSEPAAEEEPLLTTEDEKKLMERLRALGYIN